MKTILSIVLLSIALSCHAKTPPLYWGQYQNVTKTIPILLEPITSLMESSFWALLALHEAVNAMVDSLTPLDGHEVGVWTYNLMEHNNSVWMDKSYPTRDVILMTSYMYTPQTKVTTWIKRLQFTVIDQWTGNETTTVTWDNNPPLVPDFNKLKVTYQRLALEDSHDYTFKYDATGSTMFYCYRTAPGGGYPRPLRVTVYGLYWKPKFQNDYMKKTYIQYPTYEYAIWTILPPNGFVTWSLPDPPMGLNVEVHSVGEATAFYQFPPLIQ
jgi:hypothetical protein